ncbi:uncharacterized protein [Ptychodera flava]|uniref:uncharacterized protein n=1 Tax=Ptychodera flava TaxID=63121 RepID=UPI00396A0332
MKTKEKATLCKQQASQTEVDMTGRKPSQLLLLEIDPKDEIQHSAERFAPLIFNSGTYTRWKGKHYDILQLPVKMTGQVRHVLSCRPEILALLGVRRYLVKDTDGADLSNTDLEEVVTGGGTPILSRIDVTHSVSTQAKSLLLYDVSPKQHKLYDISYYLDLAVTSLNKNSKFKIESSEKKRKLEEKIFALETEKGILENQLAEAQQQRLVLENQNRENTLARQSAESVAAKQLTDIYSLKNELENLKPKNIEKEIRALKDRIKEKDKIIDDFKYKLSKLRVSDKKYDAELQEKIAEIVGEDYPSKEPEKGET